MTQPAAPQEPVADPGNRLLAVRPARIYVKPINADDGQSLLAVTIRTETTTLTVMLNAEDCAVWGNVIRQGGLQLSGGGQNLVLPTMGDISDLMKRKPDGS